MMGVMRPIIDAAPHIAVYYSDAFNTYHALRRHGERTAMCERARPRPYEIDVYYYLTYTQTFLCFHQPLQP